MNKIHNPLGAPGSLNVDDIKWEEQEANLGKNTRKYPVPVMKGTVEPGAEKIWKKYFALLFLHFHLLERFKHNAEEVKTHARNFYNHFYIDENEVDKKKLLTLLTCDPREEPAWEKDDSIEAINAITKVFNYKYLTAQYRNEFADFIQALGVDVCPYCGRAFTTTVKKKKEGFVRANQVDHYYPKSQYPWLALSIWNLIPACGPCNNLKSDDTDPFLYPYTEEMGDIYRFCTHPVKGVGYLVGTKDSEADYNLTLELITKEKKEPEYFERAENEIGKLNINDLYSVHNKYVCDIFRQRYIFGLPYIDDLVSSFPELFPGREDVRAMLYMKSIKAEDIGRNPLDKLTRDINIEINQLTGEEI